jgi:hypothetical protein
MRSVLTPGLLLGLSLSIAGPALAQDWAGKVATVLAQAEAAKLERVYELGLQLTDQVDDKQADALRDAIVAAAGHAGDKGRLAAAVALQDLRTDTLYGKDILDLLTPVAQSKDDEARGAALALLGEDRCFNTKILPTISKLLEQTTKDELVAPRVRLEAAQSLWRVGGTTDQRAVAKTAIEQFLRSTDADLRARGALALAEFNVTNGEAWSVLRAIEKQPNDLGRRAHLYVQREEERRQFESLVNKLVESKKGDGSSGAGDKVEYRLLDELRDRIHASHVDGAKVKDEELMQFAAKGMLAGLDPHSTFFTSDEFQRFFFDLNREYGGIGAFVNFDQDNDFSVIRPIYSGPAYRAGLLSGDKILEVDGWETANHTSEEIISRLKGRPETNVTIKVFRPGWQEAQQFTITRREVHVPSVNHTMIPGDIGYLELVNFSSNTSAEFDDALYDVM